MTLFLANLLNFNEGNNEKLFLLAELTIKSVIPDKLPRKTYNIFHITLSILFFLNFISIGSSQEINIVLAIDTSGSVSYNDFYLKAILEGIPKLLDRLHEMIPKDARVGLVSWDDDVDFIMKPTDNYSMVLESLKELSAHEGEFTDLNQALYGAESAFNEPPKYVWTKNILIIIAEDGEYNNLSASPNIGKYTTYCILLDAKKGSHMLNALRNISSISRRQYYAIPSYGGGYVLEHILESIIIDELFIFRDKMHVNSTSLKQDILQKNNESIIVKTAIIEGDLILNQTDIKKELQFIDCVFNGSFDLSYTDLYSHVRFENVKFERDSDFRNANFCSNVEFVDVQFLNRSSFSGTTFNEIALFYKNDFARSAIFEGAKFLGHDKLIS